MASKDLTYLNTAGPFDIYDKGKLKEPVDSLEEYKTLADNLVKVIKSS